MTDMDGAPPSHSHGDNGGYNSSSVRDHLLWALSYGVASAIALRTIDALASKPKKQPKEKEQVKEKTTTTTTTANPTVCHVVFPSVTTIITNSKDSSTLGVGTKKEDQYQTATASSSTSPTKVSEKNGGDTAVNASNRFFSRSQAPQAKAPPICKHVLDFYYDCLHVASEKKCEGYFNITEKCHQMGPTSADNSTLHPPAELLHMSYHGCRKKNQYDSCKKYLTYDS